MPKTFVLGPLRGNYKGLVQVLEKSRFDHRQDTLITLGDLSDGYDEGYECLNTLSTLCYHNHVMGKRDYYMVDFLAGHSACVPQDSDWKATMRSYYKHIDPQYRYSGIAGLLAIDIPAKHRNLWNRGHPYFLNNDGQLFVYAGFDPLSSLSDTAKKFPQSFAYSTMIVDRVRKGICPMFKDSFTDLFIGGGFPTMEEQGTTLPLVYFDKIYMLDTGSGREDGKLTIMNVATKEWWQSDSNLYNEASKPSETPIGCGFSQNNPPNEVFKPSLGGRAQDIFQ